MDDGNTSPCIDAGDPSASPYNAYSYETFYNGERVNIGAYGNTAEASRSSRINFEAPYTVWTGAVNAYWDNAGNWDAGLPSLTLSAVIPTVGANPLPTLNANGQCYNLQILGSATLTIAANNLDVSGSVLGGGTLAGSSPGSITFVPVSDKRFTGRSISMGAGTFPSLVFNCAGWRIRATGNLNVSGNITITAGCFDLDNLEAGVTGNFTNNAYFNCDGGTVTFNGSGAPVISGTGSFGLPNNLILLEDHFTDGTYDDGWATPTIEGTPVWWVDGTFVRMYNTTINSLVSIQLDTPLSTVGYTNTRLVNKITHPALDGGKWMRSQYSTDGGAIWTTILDTGLAAYGPTTTTTAFAGGPAYRASRSSIGSTTRTARSRTAGSTTCNSWPTR